MVQKIINWSSILAPTVLYFLLGWLFGFEFIGRNMIMRNLQWLFFWIAPVIIVALLILAKNYGIAELIISGLLAVFWILVYWYPRFGFYLSQ